MAIYAIAVVRQDFKRGAVRHGVCVHEVSQKSKNFLHKDSKLEH